MPGIERIESESEEGEGEEMEGEGEGEGSDSGPRLAKVQEEEEHYRLNEYLPADLANLLREKEIPLEYVRGLLLVREQHEIKSVRRLKVERYL